MSSSGRDRPKRASLGAALVATAAASSCCLGPLLLGALGLGGAASCAWLAAYRPALLALTAALLGLGFYFAYRGPKASPDTTTP
ncbi:MAG TPA: mercuric transporter MerT family protein [Polyangiaceae bacterium]|nr:mercuric transporter MerT family protein [Polyangiaceae bacterium]